MAEHEHHEQELNDIYQALDRSVAEEHQLPQSDPLFDIFLSATKAPSPLWAPSHTSCQCAG